jgi:alcohol dehydrogenase class IV
VVVALGGGSVLDAAKVTALLATNPGRAADYDYRREPLRAGLPVLAVPTTAGTGAETNGFGVVEVVIDGVVEGGAARRKIYLGHDSVRPRVAVLDPELTLALPSAATAATGMDALVHGIESLASRGATPVSTGYARRAVALAGRWLPEAVAHGESLEARSQMLLAAHLAGRALTLSGLGLVHGLGHTLTTLLGTVHGVALAAVLPEVMDFCADGSRHARLAYSVAARALGSDDAITTVADLATGVGVRSSLSRLGLTGEAVAQVARAAVEDVVSANSPRPASQADVEDLLRAAM